jgi:hypothetical protein
MRKETLAGKFALTKSRWLLSGYYGMIKIIAADARGVTAIKPEGRLCELCRHEIRVPRNQRLAEAEWLIARRNRLGGVPLIDFSPGRAP